MCVCVCVCVLMSRFLKSISENIGWSLMKIGIRCLVNEAQLHVLKSGINPLNDNVILMNFNFAHALIPREIIGSSSMRGTSLHSCDG